MISIFLIGIFLLCAGVLTGLSGWLLAHFVHKSPDGQINIRQGGFIAKTVFILASGGGILIGLAIVSFIIAGLWYGFAVVFKHMTPGKLALLSLAIGILPFATAMLGVGLARAVGGQVDARGASGCFLFGRDLNPLVYTLFMSHWGVLLTGGLAMIGLTGAGIWALIN